MGLLGWLARLGEDPVGAAATLPERQDRRTRKYPGGIKIPPGFIKSFGEKDN